MCTRPKIKIRYKELIINTGSRISSNVLFLPKGVVECPASHPIPFENGFSCCAGRIRADDTSRIIKITDVIDACPGRNVECPGLPMDLCKIGRMLMCNLYYS